MMSAVDGPELPKPRLSGNITKANDKDTISDV